MAFKRGIKRKTNVRRRLTFGGKKRRTTRRGRKTNAFTSQSGSGGAVQYKARRTSRRAYRKHLWNSTLFKEHYRSIGAVGTSMNTPASTNGMSILAEKAIDNGTATNFWLAGGGAIAPDTLQALPAFSGDITIRGGKIGLRIANTLDAVASAATTIHGTAMLVRTTKNFSAAAITTPQLVGWDTSLIPNFDTSVGRVLYRKNFLLKDSDTALIEYRIRLEKIDVGDFNATFNTYLWVIMAGNVDNSASHGMAVTKYFNLSFSADAI